MLDGGKHKLILGTRIIDVGRCVLTRGSSASAGASCIASIPEDSLSRYLDQAFWHPSCNVILCRVLTGLQIALTDSLLIHKSTSTSRPV